MTPAEITQAMSALYAGNANIRKQFYELGEKALALSFEYHLKRIPEHLTGLSVDEETLLYTLDARETPVSLNKFLTEFAPGGRPAVPVSRIIFDRTEGKIYVFGSHRHV